MTKAESLADRLKEAMDDRGWSPRDLDEAMQPDGVRGSSFKSIYRYLAGDEPSIQWIHAAANRLGVRPAWLETGEQPKTAEDGPPPIVTDAERRLLLRLRAPRLSGNGSQAVRHGFGWLLQRVEASLGQEKALTATEYGKIAAGLEALVLRPTAQLEPRPASGEDDDYPMRYADHLAAYIATLAAFVPLPGKGFATADELIERLEKPPADPAKVLATEDE